MFIIGYPIAEWMIEILLDAEGYRPMEIDYGPPTHGNILLKLRIASPPLAFAVTLVYDLALNGRK